MRFAKARFYFRLFKAFWRKHRKIIFVSLGVTLLAVLFAPKLTQFGFLKKQQKIGLVGRYTLVNLPYEITSLVSYGLTIPLPDGSVEPGLAEKWAIEENGRVYLFTLKENVSWQDGTKVIAKDINYNFSDVNMKIIDEKTIRFELKEPFSPFPAVVSRPILKKNSIGLGDYKIKTIQQSGQIIRKLVLVPTQKKDKPNLIFHFYPNEEAAKIGYKLGEVDILEDIFFPGELENWTKTKIESLVKYDRYTGLFFNTQNEKFTDKPVRQSLAYAIRKSWQPRAFSSYNLDSWAYNKTVKPYEFDLDNAKTLLNQNGENQSVDKIILSTVPSLQSVAEKIKEDWQQLNIETEIRFIQSPTEDFEVLLVTQQIPRDPDQYTLWHSTQTSNLSKYKSPKLDKLLEDGRKTLDQEERETIYQDFQRFLVEESPAVFLFYPTVYSISRQ